MKYERGRVYTWEFPVRFTHWINFLCVLALSVTGYYVGRPFIHAYSSTQYIMGWMRFIHFVAAYAFLMSIIIRLYWSLVGNKHACICEWLPFTGEKLKRVADDIKCYLFLSKSSCHVGHTALGGLTYLLLFLVFLFEVFSGFALYSVNHSGVIWALLGGWLKSIMELSTIRLYHHLFMYVILVFAMVHVYIAWFSDSRDKTGLMGSIFTGYKFIAEKDMKQ
ncbi:MAG: Ni/Fe-hydrogenase, b-type cytochrome subunit [Nitrospiraceae bacterium]|nr:MAG: Ni/Fe-hydrogenase, b-type cytochrome subunit [Nitrospiraceae bacterium]